MRGTPQKKKNLNGSGRISRTVAGRDVGAVAPRSDATVNINERVTKVHCEQIVEQSSYLN